MSQTNERAFRIAFTRDFYLHDGTPKFREFGLDVLDGQQHIQLSTFDEHRPQISPEQLDGVQGVIVLTPTVAAESLSASDDLLAIGRFGVGYDTVNVHACTNADVVAFITTGAVDRSVAEATVAWMLGLTHHVRAKDRLVRTGKWDDRSQYMGCELRNRTLGIIGFGGIGRALVSLLEAMGMNPPIAYDPYVNPAVFAELGVRPVDLDELLSTADFVSLHCPLNDQTRDLIAARELEMMKPNAYLINTARGSIVNEDALYDVLKQGRIAGAAIDCFAGEPVTSPHRFAEFENVLLAPHSISWTNELFGEIGRMACRGMLELSLGQRPEGVLNPEVFERSSFQEKWERLRFEK